mgnify:CR=1 FL=1
MIQREFVWNFLISIPSFFRRAARFPSKRPYEPGTDVSRFLSEADFKGIVRGAFKSDIKRFNKWSNFR